MSRGARIDRGRFVVPALAVLTVLPRLPNLQAPLSSDEGGLLLVAAQWHPGSSLYGDYWVDRPPLLIALYSLAHLLGGVVALRVLGCAAAVATVVLAGAVGRVVAGRSAGWWVALAGAGLVSTPLHDTWQVSGEMLAAPLVLGGVLLLLVARPREAMAVRRDRALLNVGAGCAAAAAFLVKQSFVDVFVMALALALVDRWGRPRRGGSLGATLVPFAAGALSTTGLTLVAAAWRGTSTVGLWDAVVLFRSEAALVIATSASAATEARFDRFPLAFLGSGAAFVVVIFGLRCAVRRTDRLAWAAAVMLAWEGFAVVAGGSYWMHYLLGLVPGLCLALAIALSPGERRPLGVRLGPALGAAPWLGPAVALFIAASSATAIAVVHDRPVETTSTLAASRWLEHHHRAGDTAVVAYGRPELLAEAGMTSPYAELWSLPVRVRDPALHDLAAVLRGRAAPDWVLVWGQWRSWGIRAGAAERVVDHRYHRVADVCGWIVYLHDGERRPHAVGHSCARMARS